MSAAASNALVITRRFAAPRALVWDCYSKQEHLRHWWGPKGFKVIKCTVDFRVGGIFHYGLESPDGQVMWGKWTYREIVAPEKLGVVVQFSDEKGGVSHHPWAPVWPLETYSLATFREDGDGTLLHMMWEAENGTPEEIAAFAQSHDGMKAGCEGTFSQLDAYLKTL
jgi:uncharacterized protein YndB with AHSA1/START domain